MLVRSRMYIVLLLVTIVVNIFAYYYEQNSFDLLKNEKNCTPSGHGQECGKLGSSAQIIVTFKFRPGDYQNLFQTADMNDGSRVEFLGNTFALIYNTIANVPSAIAFKSHLNEAAEYKLDYKQIRNKISVDLYENSNLLETHSVTSGLPQNSNVVLGLGFDSKRYFKGVITGFAVYSENNPVVSSANFLNMLAACIFSTAFIRVLLSGSRKLSFSSLKSAIYLKYVSMFTIFAYSIVKYAARIYTEKISSEYTYLLIGGTNNLNFRYDVALYISLVASLLFIMFLVFSEKNTNFIKRNFYVFPLVGMAILGYQRYNPDLFWFVKMLSFYIIATHLDAIYVFLLKICSNFRYCWPGSD